MLYDSSFALVEERFQEVKRVGELVMINLADEPKTNLCCLYVGRGAYRHEDLEGSSFQLLATCSSD